MGRASNARDDLFREVSGVGEDVNRDASRSTRTLSKIASV
jgi:hypothetical protein